MFEFFQSLFVRMIIGINVVIKFLVLVILLVTQLTIEICLQSFKSIFSCAFFLGQVQTFASSERSSKNSFDVSEVAFAQVCGADDYVVALH